MKSTFTLLLVLFLTATNLFGWEYRGFSVDDSRISVSNQWIVSPTIKEQIDLINALPIASEVLDFFHGVPIVLVNDPKGKYEGYYYDLRKNLKATDPRLWSSILPKSVIININNLTQLAVPKNYLSDTALLYPLLWAFADQRLPGGYENETVYRYEQDAQDHQYYGAYQWRANYNDEIPAFFADTATAYLSGKGEECYSSRQDIQKKQPEYYSYLKSLFEPQRVS
ncbi:MAG: hypothetical protein K2W99_06145 [Chthoniobacterales bacterium]|nr:hypothetical protein [Chthoniobacterales bacterium]